MPFGIWLKAMRVPFFTATIVPVILGSVAAWHAVDYFSWPLFFVMLIAAICVHAGLNLANDYFDHLSGNDLANEHPTPFSGGSRVIQQKEIAPRKILCASLVFFALAVILGLYINNVLPGDLFLVLGIIGVFMAFFYTAPPFRFGYRGWGELLVGIGFGPLIVVSAYLVQARSITAEIFYLSIPMGLLVMLILLINEFPDMAADKKTGKKTLVVHLGKQKAKNLYVVLMIGVYALLPVLYFFNALPLFGFMALLSLPLAFKAMLICRKYYSRTDKLLLANKLTIGLHIVFGALVTLGFVIDKIWF